ncbi:PulA Type II secretory pathway, pullulanase PulA and related glycosidases [Comamonadaceae bacterium]
MSLTTLLPGSASAWGASFTADGVNFALAAPDATRVELCLFDDIGTTELQRIALPARTGPVWHGLLPGAGAGLVYGYRVHGPWAHTQGHRFNPAKLLLDPYAMEVVGRYNGSDLHWAHTPESARGVQQPDPRDNAATALKARVVSALPPASAGPKIDPAQRVLYELHVKGFTQLHPDVPLHLRGTYAGLSHPAAIEHLKALGITTVSVMPVAARADEERLQHLGLSNYWGYSPIAWSAPEPRYWSGTPGSSPRSEFRAMVDALHAAGLEVILDVVYNHTAETDEFGPLLSLRGIANATYYHLEPEDPARYINWTGCGNCVNLNHPIVLRTVMDSLRTWVQDFGVDGFRFDLAPVMARGTQDAGYRFQPHAPWLLAVAQDPVLRNRLMVAEPWDIGPGGYQLGAFPHGWLEWNDRFRDTQRSAWLRHGASRGALAHHLAGSADAFARGQRAAYSSVNFVTAHDGFNLMDVVSYCERHNEANGEHNRDGHGHNLSVNHGVEGASDLPAVQEARARHRRTLLAATVLSLGTPMLLAGDELGHTQGGNNNAYCQDNATTWLRWDASAHHETAFWARAIALRRQLPALQAGGWWRSSAESAGCGPVANWALPDGRTLQPADWDAPHGGAMVVALQAGTPDAVLLLLNPSPHEQVFCLPQGAWRVVLDSALPELPAEGVPVVSTVITLQADSLMLLT